MKPPFPIDEVERLQGLKELKVLDSLAELQFDDITDLAGEICDTPLAAITLIDANRQWFKSRVGINFSESPRDDSFCAHTILEDDLVVVPDTTVDVRFSDNPFVTSQPHIRFYAGMPLVMSSGHKLGTLCVLDTKSRVLSTHQQEALRRLGRQTVLLLEARPDAVDEKVKNQLKSAITDQERFFTLSLEMLCILNSDGTFRRINSAFADLLGFPTEEIIGQSALDYLHPDDRHASEEAMGQISAGHAVRNYVNRFRRRDGSYRSILWATIPEGAHFYAAGRDITERLQAEEANKESQRFLQATLDALESHICVLDEKGEIIAVNQAWEQFSKDNQGTAVSCGIGANYLQVCDEARGAWSEEAPALAQSIRNLVQDSQRAFSLEYPCHSPTEQRWFSVSVTRFSGEAPVRLVVAHKNITERKQAENRIRTSEMNLARAQQIAHLGSWELDLTNTKNLAENPLQWSDEVFRILGYEPGQIETSYENFLAAVHPDDLPGMIGLLSDAVAGGKAYSVEHRFLLPDGGERYVREESGIIFDEAGKPLKMVGTVQDITDRKRDEDQLVFQKTLLEAQTEASLDGILVVSGEGTVLSYNQRFLAMWEIPPDVVATAVDAQVIQVVLDKVAEPDQFLEKVTYLYAHRGEQSHDEITLRNGQTFDRYSAPVSGPGDSYYGRVWFFRDISERRQTEVELRQMRDELEVRVENRTVELARTNTALQSEVLERERAQREEAAQARQQKALAELGRKALLDLDLNGLFGTATALIANTLGVELCSYWTLLPDTQTLRRIAGVGVPEELKASPERTIGDDSQIGYCALHNEPVITENMGRETRFHLSPFLIAKGITSMVTVPVHDGALDGVLVACSQQPQKFRQQEIYFLRTAANTLASAIARKRAEEEILKLNSDLLVANDDLRANEARLLQGNQISTDLMRLRVRSSEELDLALRQITEAACTMLDIERSNVWIFNEAGTTLRCLDNFQRGAGAHSNGLELPEDEHYFPAIKAERILVADDARTDPAMSGYWETYFEPNGITSVLDVALVVGGKHMGVLCCEHVGDPRQWQAEDRTFASSIASVCSLVLESFERTQAETALHQAKEIAESATEEANTANLAKSEFLSRMSHELRTPLNAILGFGQIMEMHLSDSDQSENIQQVLKAGRHLLALINEVLDIARIEAGHLTLSLEPILVGSLIREVLDLVAPLAAAWHVKLVNEIRPGSANQHIWADNQRVRQVLLNLLSNAVKYNREGGTATVALQIASDEPFVRDGESFKGLLRVEVRDTGPGLSAADISRLFVPFERLGAARSDVEGTGIGLTLCKHLVDAMHGRIGVTSKVGEGSIFWFEMPLVEGPLVTALASIEEQILNEIEPGVDNFGTILHIEDNLSNIALVEIALKADHFRGKLLTAMQGSVGLDLATQHHPDLILLDVHLPDIMGDVVLKHLKSDASTKDIPVVVLSADATSSQIEKLLAGGAEAYLTKPLDIKEFYQVVKQYVKKTG